MKKKLIVAFAGLIVAAAAIAATNVVSVNAVGYVKVDMLPGGQYNMIGLNFLDTSGQTNKTLLDVFGTNQLAKQNLYAQCDKVFLWARTEQQYVKYAQKLDGQFYSSTNWSGAPVNPEIPIGTAIWIQSKTAAASTKEITLLGGVPFSAQISDSLPGDPVGKPYFFIANPYPVETALDNLINTNDGAKAANLYAQADKIFLWETNVQQYVKFGLKLDNKWYSSTNWGGTPAGVSVAPGQGFVFQTANNFTWTETRPYSL